MKTGSEAIDAIESWPEEESEVDDDAEGFLDGIAVGKAVGRGEGWRVASTVVTGLLSTKAIPRSVDACVSTSARPELTEAAKDELSVKPTVAREVVISQETVHV